MTSLEKKAIDHSIAQLKKVQTHKIIAWLLGNGLISGSEEEKRAFFNSLEHQLQEHVYSHVSEAEAWLTTLATK